jgi:DNA repair protein RadC
LASIRDLPPYDRPREKLEKRGPQALSDVELIALILGKGTRKKDVLSIADDVSRCIKDHPDAARDVNQLLRIEGLGLAKAAQIAACFELARRYLIKEPVRISSPQDILPFISYLSGKKQEHFVCLTLNGAGEIIENRVITVGLLNHSLVHPREVFADAITDRAASVILVHNHPSGSLEPSSQDLAITRQLAEAGSLLGIRVLDHIIISHRGLLSMRERGLL